MEEEISLRELIEILLKRWKIIAVITLTCILIAGVVSFYIMEPVYEAKTMLMASYATEKLTNSNSGSDDVEGILESITMYPAMTIQTYKEQLKSPEILQSTIDELGLDKEEVTVNGLMKMISLETIKDTNLIAIKVSHNNPEIASNIANTLAVKFTNFITDMARDHASKSSDFLQSQLEVEKLKLDEASLELKQFLSQPRGVDELKGEVSSMLSMLNSYKTQIVQKEVELGKIRAGLSAAEYEMNNTPKVITTSKSLDNDTLLNQMVSEETGLSIVDTSRIIMNSEEVNDNYLDLKMQVSSYKISKAELEREIEEIKIKIDDYQVKLEETQHELADKDYEKTLVQRKVSISQNTYNAFLQKYEESLVAESTKVGESSIDIISQAMVPLNPVGPKKLLNMAIGGVLGLMLGVSTAFFIAYWKSTAKTQQ